MKGLLMIFGISAAVIACAFSISCSSEGPAVLYVFPEGFRGLAVLRAHEPNGESVEPINNTITLTFPDDGVLEIKGDLPTLKWHTAVARYANGGRIPVIQPDHQIPDSTIAFRPAGLKDTQEDWYVVGTLDDLKKAIEKKAGFKYPTSR